MNLELTFNLAFSCGTRANSCRANMTTTNAPNEEDNLEARQTEAKMAALSEMALVAL